MRFQIALTSEDVAGFGRFSIQRASTVEGEKKEDRQKKIERMAVKPKSADMHVGRPNNVPLRYRSRCNIRIWYHVQLRWRHSYVLLPNSHVWHHQTFTSD